MKKIFYITLTYFTLGLLSCESNLDEVPLSFLEESNSFQSAADANSAVNAVYHRLRELYGMTMINLADLNGDECEARDDFAFGNEVHRNLFNNGLGLFNSFYINSYGLIDRANRVIENVPGITMNEIEKKGIIAEARFLRALTYFNLVRAFGDVPLVVATTNDIVNINIPRNPSQEVYEQIVQDLSDAEKDLPLRYTQAGKIGRATMGAAKSILAKVYLTLRQWENASQKAKEVIDLGEYTLFQDYRHVFAPETKNGTEHIFSVQYSCILTQYGSPMAQNFAIFFTYPINMVGGPYQVTSRHVDSYLSGDYRKQVTVINERARPNGTIEVSRTGPHMDKYWDDSPCGLQAARNNFPVIRYADVLLMYAEALNELNGPSKEASEAINAVRERARNINSDSELVDLEDGLNQVEFREAVLQERSWELCFEGHRRWDLLRTGTYIEKKIASGVPTQDRHLLYPIPINQLDVNSKLTQNPGY